MTIALLKSALRIDGDHLNDQLQSLWEASAVRVEEYCGGDLAGRFPDGIPKPINVAILFLASELFRNQGVDGSGISGMPPPAVLLLEPYRAFMGEVD